jgi:hypothetical protein
MKSGAAPVARASGRWVVIILSGLWLGSQGASLYAQRMAPIFAAVAGVIAQFHPWKITSVVVIPSEQHVGNVLRLTGEVYQNRGDSQPAAIVNDDLSVGAAIETPLVFWSLVLGWPARTMRQYVIRLAIAVPTFCGLLLSTTMVQLMWYFADVSAVLAGDPAPRTLWALWSRCLESGGRFALEISSALLCVALAQRFGVPRSGSELPAPLAARGSA